MITWIKEHGRWVVLAALILINVVLLILLFARQASYSAVPAPALPTWPGTVGQPTPQASTGPSATPGRDQPSPEVVAISADDSSFVAAREMDDCDGVVVQAFTTSGRGLDDAARPCRAASVGDSDRIGVTVNRSDQWVWAGARSSVS